MVRKLSEKVKLEPEEVEAYLPQVPENFYCNPKVFRKLLGIW